MSVQKRNSLKNSLRYQDVFCEKLVAFFDVPAYHVSEFTKKDGTVAFVESASDLPTFAAFAKMLGTTSQTLKKWEQEHPAFAHAAQVAREVQGNILLQNALRGNYAASFAVFAAKNLLGWSEGKEVRPEAAALTVRWEEEDEKNQSCRQ